MLDSVEDFLNGIDPDDFLEQFLSLVENQTTCKDIGEVCDIRVTSFGNCCVKCGLLPDFWNTLSIDK